MKSNKSKGFRSFVKEKGYYIVLLLCAVAVGVSGYFLITGNQEDSSSEPDTSFAEQTEDTHPSVKDVIATEPTQKKPLEAETVVAVRPVPGESIHPFAVDALAYNETTRDWRVHEGVDLRAAAGDTVCAAMDGTVHAIYEDDALGMTIVLRHPGEYTTHYSNLSESVTLKVGDTVKSGEVIGTVGQTALVETSEEPHLHFAVYLNYVPIDPLRFLEEHAALS